MNYFLDIIIRSRICTINIYLFQSSHTKMWWVVDLLETKRVSMVVIYNRGDCCGKRKIFKSKFQYQSHSITEGFAVSYIQSPQQILTIYGTLTWYTQIMNVKNISCFINWVLFVHHSYASGDRLVNFYIGVGQTFTNPSFNPDNFEVR